ncbi:thiamine phosphate synthase [Paraflavisolibacter sp. H34]|uniref:thiamine phosphate synthase n=1 Tax=Huijunlia imazamoxiresistens TaxID=3127457 RepID=UPI003018ADF0
MDRIIVITPPGELPGETELYEQLLRQGLQRLHLRKPGWPKDRLLQLAQAVAPRWRHRLVVHHQPEVAVAAGLGGLHCSLGQLGGAPGGGISLSCSVHHWAEAEAAAPLCDYLFVSPVFDSLSKSGYAQNSALHQVPEPLKSQRLFALGGITDKNLHRVRAMGYYGAALLGYLWNEPARAAERLKTVLQILS